MRTSSENTVDKSDESGIINIRSSGKENVQGEHYYEFIESIDYNDNKAVAKAIRDFEIENKDSKIEKCLVITPNGEKYIVYGDKWTVNTELLGDKMKGSINEHNHVTGESQYSFSYEDLKSSISDGSKISMAFDEKYRYMMEFSEIDITEDDLYESFDSCKNEVEEINFQHQYFGDEEHIDDEDVMHEVIQRTCERVGIKYERTRKA